MKSRIGEKGFWNRGISDTNRKGQFRSKEKEHRGKREKG